MERRDGSKSKGKGTNSRFDSLNAGGGTSRFDCLKPTPKPRWASWQIGEDQLQLPDTVPFSRHDGISFACFHCGSIIIENEQIHQLKVSAVWSNCLLPETVIVSEEPKTNPAKKTTFFEVFCLRCKRDGRYEGTTRRNLGAAYLEKYQDGDTGDWVSDKVFPCIKIAHIYQLGKQAPRNNLVLVGVAKDVELKVRSLTITDLVDRNAELGILRPALTMDTYQRKKQNEELSKRVRQLEENQSTHERERQDLATQVENLKQQGEEEYEELREKSKRIEEERRLLDLQVEKNNADLRRAREALVKQQHEHDWELLKLEAERQELESATQQERLRREELEKQLTSETIRFENHIKQMAAEQEKEREKFDKLISDERKKLDDEKNSLLEQLAHIEEKKHELELRAEAGPDAEANLRVAKLRECDQYKLAETAFKRLGFDDRLLDRRFDRCYCLHCYPKDYQSVIENDGPKPYVVPRGWVRIGLKVPPQGEVQNIWEKWCVSFHGTRHGVARSVVNCGDFLMPGDKLPDGSVLASVNCAGRTDKFTYTSPTVNYAGLAFYAHPETGPRDTKIQVVFQCRQKPGTFRIRGETMGFCERWGQTELCPHVRATEIEWVSDARKTIIPYGVLLRTYPVTRPPVKYFRSPVD